MRLLKPFVSVLFIAVLPLMSFTNSSEKAASSHNANKSSVRYAYATSLEEIDGEQGLTSIVSNVVTINCESANRYSVELQFNEHHRAEIETKSRRLYNGGGSTTGWIYSGYEEAATSRRDYLAKIGSEKKRTISYFSFYCKK